MVHQNLKGAIEGGRRVDGLQLVEVDVWCLDLLEKATGDVAELAWR
jgi:hypothetical protein